MLVTLAKFEIKNVIRDKMTLMMLLWPLALGAIGKYLISSGVLEGKAVSVTAMILSLITGFAYGAMSGFSLLDDRDDQVFASIQISPVSLALYVWFKIVFAYVLAVFAGYFMLWIVGAAAMTVLETFLVAALSALQVPIVALLVNAFAKNKVEGFVAMKASGFLMLLPIAGFFFLDAKEWLFAIAPGHWAAKAIQYAMLRPGIAAGMVNMNLDFYQYIIIGALYNLVLMIVTFKIFQRRTNF